MPRAVVILLIVLVALVAILFGFAMLDREVPLTHVEQPVGNAATP